MNSTRLHAKLESNPVKRNCSKTTRKRAIYAMCAHCMGCTAHAQGNGLTDHLEPGFRTHIRQCTSPGCPLFSWRPFQVKKAHRMTKENPPL